MRDDLTVIYYTCNQEEPGFEARIMRTLWHTIKPLPLISVSQKPIDFGKNICVGDVGRSAHNAWRQFQIGVQEAKTKFVCSVESDFLHPKEFFEFNPEKEDIFYLGRPLYVLFAFKGRSYHFAPKPRGSEGSMIIGKDYILRRLEEIFSGKPMWTEPAVTNITNLENLCPPGRSVDFYTTIPTVSFKTDRAMHRKTPIIRGRSVKELPGWGEVHALVRKYLYEKD